jgi:hypothetical protein
MDAGALKPDGTVVVVGASLAGWRAVETLRNEKFEGKISLVEAGSGRHLAGREGRPGGSAAHG